MTVLVQRLILRSTSLWTLIGIVIATLVLFGIWQCIRLQWNTTPPTSCLKRKFKGIVLVIVYNYPIYSSIPLLGELYGKVFPTIMFCGPKSNSSSLSKYLVEEVYIRKGYYGYICLARAMEKYPASKEDRAGFEGYLLMSDDVLLNYWNFVSFDRTKIWEGPKVPIQYKGLASPRRWYWWNSTWGIRQCQKAYDEIWALRDEVQDTQLRVEGSLETLEKNGNGRRFCYRGRSDVFYIPQDFSELFQVFAYIFYKHNVFLEIAVPTICRMLDLESDFEFMPGIYLPGRKNDSVVMDSKYFWQVYNKSLHFLHPLKLNYADGELNRALLRTWIMEYSDRLTSC